MGEQPQLFCVKQTMKLLLACLLAMVLTVTSFAEDADRFSPAVPLEDALVLAKGWPQMKRIVVHEWARMGTNQIGRRGGRRGKGIVVDDPVNWEKCFGGRFR